MFAIQNVEAKPGNHALFMVFALPDYQKATAQVKDLCGGLEAIIKSKLNRFGDSQTGAVMGFGAKAFAELFPKRNKPKELEEFKEIRGDKHLAPSTPGDLFFHIRSARIDLCHQVAEQITKALAGVTQSVDETHGFRYFDSRALIGFVDGTENPEAEEAAQAAKIPEGDEYCGSSYAFVQKYLHDSSAWDALPVEEQEKAIGRRKFNDAELSEKEKPANAHNAVTNIKDDDGKELKIVRANMPFANPSKGEFGTYFIGYSGLFSTTKRMLENMFVGEPRGNYDRLLDFSRPITGTLFFIPSADLLSELSED
ncbi:MAG: Dyp-type peroxidase [Deltaproteobacteria bacterium]|jgi:putative iron-dependent peroxidase|nr:Dyp-type peroxidase [Deltaproteobacteria bacterium]